MYATIHKFEGQCDQFSFSLMFFFQGCIKLFKSDSKDI